MSRGSFLLRLAIIALLWGIAGGIAGCGGTGDDDEFIVKFDNPPAERSAALNKE